MHTLRLAAPLLGLGLILAACGSGGASTAPATVTPATAAPASAAPAYGSPSQAPASMAPASAAPAAAGAVTVNLGDTTLGKILVDGNGMTLYAFTPDAGGASTCYNDCAASWPPLVGDGAPTLGTGVDASKVGSADRTDGTKQVTYGGMPLYHFAGDSAAGETKGQGLGGKWYVVDATGALVK